MAETAGLIVGVGALLPLCRDGFDIIKEILSASDCAPLALDRIRVQRDRYDHWRDIWLDKAGKQDAFFENFAEEEPQAARRILQLLIQLCGAFYDIDALESRFGFSPTTMYIDPRESTPLPIFEEGDPVSPDGMADLKRIYRYNLSFIRRAGYVVRPHDNHWETLLYLLREYTEALRECGPPKRIRKMEKGAIDRLEIVDEPTLRRMADALLYESRILQSRRPAQGKAYSELAKAAKFRSIIISEEQRKTKLFRMDDFHFSKSFVVSEEARSTIAILLGYPVGPEKRVVLIEWLRNPDVAQREEDAKHLARELSSPKPGATLLPNCYGIVYNHQNHDFGIVLALPAHIRGNLPQVLMQGTISRRRMPTDLRNLIDGWHPRYRDILDLGKRFEIAKRLVDAVHNIHSCGWIHTNLRSSVILFFPVGVKSREGKLVPSSEDPAPLGFDEPLLAGFDRPWPDPAPTREHIAFSYGYGPPPGRAGGRYYDDSQRAQARNFTMDYYQHPEKVLDPHAAFQRVFDIYSLGVVLLEIGLWDTLDRVLGDGPVSSRNPEATRSRLITLAKGLGGRMGSVYASVVQDCLQVRATDLADTLEFETGMAARLSQCVA